MRFFLLVIILGLFILPGCKAKHDAVKQIAVTSVNAGSTLGKVSHQYSKTGCATVVIIKKEGEKDLTLLPKDILSKEFDVDGLEIYFNYRLLKIKNPEGCNVGIPAQLTDISKK